SRAHGDHRCQPAPETPPIGLSPRPRVHQKRRSAGIGPGARRELRPTPARASRGSARSARAHRGDPVWRPERSKTAAASQSHTPRRAAPGGPIRSLAYAVGGAAGPRAFARELTCPRSIAVAHLPEPSQLVPKTAVLPWNNSVRTYVSICAPADNHQAGP